MQQPAGQECNADTGDAEIQPDESNPHNNSFEDRPGRLRRPVTQERVKMPTVTQLDIYDVSVSDSMLPPPKKKRLVRQH